MRSNSTRVPPNLSGLCQCGCGGVTNIATKTNPKDGHVKGEHYRFITNHNQRLPNLTPPNPSGLCQCGCGVTTPVSPRTFKGGKIVRGEHVRFIAGHHRRHTKPPYVIEDRGYKTPCHIWQRTINDKGYGTFKSGGKSFYAHLVYFEKTNGLIPEGLDIDHLCRVRCCVNADHLEPVTTTENIRRGLVAKLTWSDVDQIRSLTGSMSQAAIGELFGVCQAHISRIQTGRAWVEDRSKA